MVHVDHERKQHLTARISNELYVTRLRCVKRERLFTIENRRQLRAGSTMYRYINLIITSRTVRVIETAYTAHIMSHSIRRPIRNAVLSKTHMITDPVSAQDG